MNDLTEFLRSGRGGTATAVEPGMSFFKNLFGRRSRRFNLFRRRSHRFADNINPRTGGIALGAIATLAAPFVIHKLMARRAEQGQAGTATAY